MSRIARVVLPLRTCGICGRLTSSTPGDRVVWYRAGNRGRKGKHKPAIMIVHATCAVDAHAGRARPAEEWAAP